MKNALLRINELQKEIIDKSKSIEGYQNYVDEMLTLYDEDEKQKAMTKQIRPTGQETKEELH